MSDDKELIGKTIVYAEIGGYGIKLKFSDGSILDYNSSDGGYSSWEIIDDTKQIEVPDNCNLVERNECLKVVCSSCYPDGGKVGCPITCYEYDRIMELPVISVPLKEEGAMTWYKNEHYTTAGIKETKPVNVGKWLPYEFGDYHWHKCSVCGTADRYIDTVDRSDRGYGKSDLESVRNYCPVCGAKMVN